MAGKRQRSYRTPTQVTRKIAVIPGVTRSAGSYMRSLPGSGEKKYVETVIPLSSIPANTGLQFAQLCTIKQNTTDTGRIGSKVTITNVNANIAIRENPTPDETATEGIVRVIFFIDKQANGAVPTPHDILQGTETAPGSGVWHVDWNNFRNLDNVQRFHIIKDKIYALNNQVAPGTGGLAGEVVRTLKLSWKGNLPMHFSGTEGTINEIRSDNFGILFVRDTIGGFSTVAGRVRVKYTDN